jgi:hypothetical protein
MKNLEAVQCFINKIQWRNSMDVVEVGEYCFLEDKSEGPRTRERVAGWL